MASSPTLRSAQLGQLGGELTLDKSMIGVCVCEEVSPQTDDVHAHWSLASTNILTLYSLDISARCRTEWLW